MAFSSIIFCYEFQFFAPNQGFVSSKSWYKTIPEKMVNKTLEKAQLGNKTLFENILIIIFFKEREVDCTATLVCQLFPIFLRNKIFDICSSDVISLFPALVKYSVL